MKACIIALKEFFVALYPFAKLSECEDAGFHVNIITLVYLFGEFLHQCDHIAIIDLISEIFHF